MRPAITASLNAVAICIGYFADAIAVLTKTASAPISIAFAASEGAPIPASIITGTWLWAMIISKKSNVRSPLLLPMGAAKGITADVPASSSLLQSTGSACI
ncbi:hypothetical protein D3C87_1905670 [compost metagenome]